MTRGLLHGMTPLYSCASTASGVAFDSTTPGAKPLADASELPPHDFELHVFKDVLSADSFEAGCRITSRNDVVLERSPVRDGWQPIFVLVARLDSFFGERSGDIDLAIPLIDHRLTREQVEERDFLAPVLRAEAQSPKHTRRIGGVRRITFVRRTEAGALLTTSLIGEHAWLNVEVDLRGGEPYSVRTECAHYAKMFEGAYGNGRDAELAEMLSRFGVARDDEGRLCWRVGHDDLVEGLASKQLLFDELHELNKNLVAEDRLRRRLSSPFRSRILEAVGSGGRVRVRRHGRRMGRPLAELVTSDDEVIEVPRPLIHAMEEAGQLRQNGASESGYSVFVLEDGSAVPPERPLKV